MVVPVCSEHITERPVGPVSFISCTSYVQPVQYSSVQHVSVVPNTQPKDQSVPSLTVSHTSFIESVQYSTAQYSRNIIPTKSMGERTDGYELTRRSTSSLPIFTQLQIIRCFHLSHGRYCVCVKRTKIKRPAPFTPSNSINPPLQHHNYSGGGEPCLYRPRQ